MVDEVKTLEPQRTQVRELSGGMARKVKPGGLARLFSFITLWGLTWF